MYLTDFLQDDYQQWFPGDVVKIQAPTGSGKTTYVLTVLRDEVRRKGKNILYVYNRRILGQQMKAILGKEIGLEGTQQELAEIKCFDGIQLCSYQSLQVMMENKRWLSLSDFMYVVFDEIHYILRDSQFQPEILFFLDWLSQVMSHTRTIWIFISATIDMTWEFLCGYNPIIQSVAKRFQRIYLPRAGVTLYEGPNTYNILDYRPRYLWEYRIESNYYDYEPFYFYEFQSLLPEICNETSGKWLIFVSNKEKGKEFADLLSPNLGNKMVRYLDSEMINKSCDILEEISINQKFEGKVLLATSVLDNGISICDPELHNIVMSTLYYDDFIQMLGRKRRMAGEKIRVFLPIKDLRSINGEWYLKCITNLRYASYDEYQFKMQLLKDKGLYYFAQKYMFFDVRIGKYVLNPAGLYMLRYMATFISYLKDNIERDEYFFVREQLEWLGKVPEIQLDRCVDIWVERRRKEELYIFLNSIKDKMLDYEKQKEFSEAIASFAMIPGKWQTFRKKRINTFLKGMGSPFLVDSQVIKRKTFWIVREVKNEK